MASQQSWSEWLWSAYSSVVNPSTTTATTEQSHSQAANSTTSSSPYGPYVRTGRGGAGNFTWQSQQTPQTAEANLEAQTPSTLSDQRKAAASLEHHDTDSALKSKAAQKPAAQYVRVGRNLVLRSEMQQASEPEETGKQPPVSTSASSARVAHPGRGGAGNYAVAAELNGDAESERVRRDEIEAEKRRGKIEEQMESALPAPPDAWLGGKRRETEVSRGPS